ncbi:hypothetical protein YH65_00165 [Sulfurovum lithotrophicum]|uniref:Prepilin-type cleavage/methylation domain-containing protein n=1 Tax=Sulfurovum lithotrophicum TaxID=206403 RepID=A0A7U4RPQ4_9BACT|nr:type II secretion system protein [Sulfurovum lithotrophicum]AKF24000.1 hypothetical protein YH65_00165 [Sulfurovum lithotrophicum]
MGRRSAFTLLEVLISIALLGLILPALYQSVELLKDSNKHLFDYVEKAKKISKATEILYLDILSSDGNLSIKKDDFSRLCIEQTRNSLYELPSAKVCWIVMKKDHALLRVEGNGYLLPLRVDDRVEADLVMKDLEVFDVYHSMDKVLVLIQQAKKEPISFMVQGVTKPQKKKKMAAKKAVKKKRPPGNQETNGTKSPGKTPPPI